MEFKNENTSLKTQVPKILHQHWE